MKIAYANAIGDLALAHGQDPEVILATIGQDGRIGTQYLGYGYGYGGPCLPKDNQVLAKFAQTQGTPLPLSEATISENEKHLAFQKEAILAQYPPEEIILFQGITYKSGSVLLERSQALALALALAKNGRQVCIQERAPVIEELKSLYPNTFSYQVVDSPPVVRAPQIAPYTTPM